jgi:hypothetical protein
LEGVEGAGAVDGGLACVAGAECDQREFPESLECPWDSGSRYIACGCEFPIVDAHAAGAALLQLPDADNDAEFDRAKLLGEFVDAAGNDFP